MPNEQLRGFNVAVLNPKTKKGTSVNVFDTYQQGLYHYRHVSIIKLQSVKYGS
jgi:hypothetical protein